MLLAKDVVSVEDGFVNLLQHIPGTKEDKQAYFKARGIGVPRTSYETMWEALTSRLHRSGAASVVFELLRHRMPRRLAELLRQAHRGKSVSLRASEPALVDDLFFQNGNLRRIGELFLGTVDDGGMIRVARPSAVERQPSVRVKEPAKPYDIALSFAGEDRKLVAAVANLLRSQGIKVFYDKFEEVQMWGRDLTAHLAEIYKNSANYCAMFISVYYVSKAWPQLERQHAQSRALIEKREYILPIRLDESEVPGLPSTIGYIDARNLSEAQIAKRLRQKIRS